MDILVEAILEVRAGKRRFSPATEAVEDVRAFQSVAAALDHASNSGLIGRVQMIRSAVTGQWQVILVEVLTGLTYLGEKFLEKEPDDSERRPWSS